MLTAQPDLVAAEDEDVEVVAAIVVRIALDAAAVRSRSHWAEDVDHGTVSGRSWSA